MGTMGTNGAVPTRLARGRRWMFRDQRATLFLAVMVLAVDIALAVIHVVIMAFWDAPNFWRVDMDGSYAEAYQYVKYFWVIVLLAVCARQNRTWAIAAWIPLYVFLMADDALMLHEIAGVWYSWRPWAVGVIVGPQATGELIAIALAGIVLAIPILFAYLRGDRRIRWLHQTMIVLIAALLFFAVFVDAFHSFFVDVRLLDRALGFVEDAGEMVVLSVVVLFAFRVNVGGGVPGIFSLREPAEAADEPSGKRRVAIREA